MNFVAFDLETTGIQPQNDYIVEIGAVKFIDGAPQRSFGTLINPGIPIPPEASAVNCITNEMLRGKPSIEEVMEPFADFCSDLPLVAHNAPFDYKFVLHVIKKYRTRAPKGVVLDTLILARQVFPGLANYKLWTLVRYFDFPAGTFHRAEEDSVYCGRLFLKIIQVLEKRMEYVSLDDLVKMMGKSEMRFPQYVPQSDQLRLF